MKGIQVFRMIIRHQNQSAPECDILLGAPFSRVINEDTPAFRPSFAFRSIFRSWKRGPTPQSLSQFP